MADGDDAILALDKILVFDLAFDVDDFGFARRRELVLDRLQLALDDVDDASARREDCEIFADFIGDLVQLVSDLVTAESGQARKTQFEDGLRLLFRKPVRAGRRHLVARIGDQLDQRYHVLRRPVARHQLLFGFGGRRGKANELDHLVDVGDGDRQADQHVSAIARLVQQVLDAARNDVLAEARERRDEILQRQAFRTAAVDRQHVGAERRLQVGILVEVIQNDIGDRITLQLDDDANAFAVRFIPEIGDAFDLLVAHEIGDLFDQRALVHLIGNFGDDEGFAILADVLDGHAGAHDDRAAAFVIGRENATASENETGRREIRALNDLRKLVDADLGIVEVGDAGVDDLAEVMRRDVRRHADRDAASTVDEQVRKFGGQNRRLLNGAVVVVAIVDRIVVEIVEQEARDLGETRFRVAFGRRRVAVDRAEVALPVDERHAHREILRETHERVVDREVAVRVILAHHLADDARRLDVLLIPIEPELVHREENAAVHGLQTVADIGQRARDDDAHRVVEVRLLHLV